MATSGSNSGRMCCWYGSSCYRKNTDHRRAYAHPGDDDWVETVNLSDSPPLNLSSDSAASVLSPDRDHITPDVGEPVECFFDPDGWERGLVSRLTPGRSRFFVAYPPNHDEWHEPVAVDSIRDKIWRRVGSIAEEESNDHIDHSEDYDDDDVDVEHTEEEEDEDSTTEEEMEEGTAGTCKDASQPFQRLSLGTVL